MTREIKFRAWDTKNSIYVKNYDLDLVLDIVWSERNGIDFHFDTVLAHDVIIEQYIGLKDKNGKEIYEGDIVDFNFEKSNTKYQIVWFPSALAFGAKSLTDYEMYKIPLEQIEVVGNIHENPELLEEK